MELKGPIAGVIVDLIVGLLILNGIESGIHQCRDKKILMILLILNGIESLVGSEKIYAGDHKVKLILNGIESEKYPELETYLSTKIVNPQWN